MRAHIRLRTLFINHSPVEGSGSGSYTRAMAEHLAERGVESFVLTPGAEASEYREGRTTYRTVTLNGLGGGAFPTFTGHPASPLTYRDLNGAQIEEYRRIISRAIADAAADCRADVIHAQHLFLLPPLARRTGLPVVTTCHGSELHFCRTAGVVDWPGVLAEAVRSSSRVVMVSEYVAGLARSSYEVPAEKTAVIHNGFDLRTFSPDVAASTPPPQGLEGLRVARGLVAGVGRLVAYKRFDVLLRALRLMQDESGADSPGAVIVGDGPERESLTRLAAELGLRNTLFLGFRTQAEVANIFARADLTVVPSREEPFGLVALESMACGTPVVASASGGLPEFVDGNVGVLVEGWEPRTWAEAVASELRGGAKERKRDKAVRRASEFTWERAAQKLIEVYRAALGRPGGGVSDGL